MFGLQEVKASSKKPLPPRSSPTVLLPGWRNVTSRKDMVLLALWVLPGRNQKLATIRDSAMKPNNGWYELRPSLPGFKLGRTLLLAAVGDDGGVHVHGEPVYAQAIKEPSINLLLYLFEFGHVKTAEETYDGFVSGHQRPAEQARESEIQTGDFGMSHAVCSAPDSETGFKIA